MSARRRSGSRPAWLLAALAMGFSLLALLAAFELGLRIAHGRLWGAPEPLVGIRMIGTGYPGSHHPRLGFVPTPGSRGRANAWGTRVTITPDGLRSNGAPSPAGPGVLVVGDSFAFGDEVDDRDAWPAALERALGRPVLNGAVFGYGFDQIVLRAEQLLGAPVTAGVDTLVVSLTPDDVRRCEFSYRYAWKPYFEVEAGGLVLRNVPVPEPDRSPPPPVAAWLRGSFAVDFVMRRLDPGGWGVPDSVRVHRSGAEVARRLVDRLAEGAAVRALRLLLVVQWQPHPPYRPIRPVVERARELGIELLDLEETLARQARAEGTERLFRAHSRSGGEVVYGHLTPEGNERVAEAVAARLRAPGLRTAVPAG